MRKLLVALLVVTFVALPVTMQSPVTIEQQSTTGTTQLVAASPVVMTIAVQSPVVVQDARADWYINGQWQPNIPFWFTLEEAIMAYFGLL